MYSLTNLMKILIIDTVNQFNNFELYMNSNFKKLLFILFPVSLVIFLFISTAYCRELSGNINETPLSNKKFDYSKLYFIPEMALLLDGRLYSNNSLSHQMITHRTFSIDILRYENIVFGTNVDETRTFKERNSRSFDPWIIHYEMDYLSLRWEFKDSYLGYFIDHLCNNIFNIDEIALYELRWYGMGFKWESHGMRLGNKNREIQFNKPGNFHFLNIFNYMTSLNLNLANGYTAKFRYNMFIKGALRYDAFLLCNVIPYLKFFTKALIDKCYSRVRFDREFEAGLRIHLSDIDITPFVCYIYKHDAEIYNGLTLKAWSSGFRLETMLYNEISETEKEGSTEDFKLFPEIHFWGQYAKFLFHKNLNFNHKLLTEITLFKSGNFSTFVNTGLLHNSPGSGGLWPYFLDTMVESGFDFLISNIYTVIEPFYMYRRFDDGNHYRGYRQHYQLAGVNIKSRNLKIGYINHGIDFDDQPGFKWLNRFGWHFSACKIIEQKNYDYNWEVYLKLLWDVIQYKTVIPFVSLSGRLLHGKKPLYEYSSETGVRLNDLPVMILFFQYINRSRSDKDNRFYRHQFLAGLRCEV